MRGFPADIDVRRSRIPGEPERHYMRLRGRGGHGGAAIAMQFVLPYAPDAVIEGGGITNDDGEWRATLWLNPPGDIVEARRDPKRLWR